MDHHQFVDEVAERADVSREQAEALTQATLWTLGERITGGEARQIAEQLPRGAASPLEFREVAAGPRLQHVRVTGGDLP
ncbi:DUF2267 domain-containing protein [Amycolatopsis mediterranei]|uniref:DUF2267 domain-containing protein n=1 Tax=Amycolatopsis mediterranei TaxID=33910 RepID=UPI003441383F